MELLPKDIYEKLEFDKILALLEKECAGELGKAAVAEIGPITDIQVLERLLNEAKEAKIIVERRDPFPLGAYADVAEDLRMLEIDGYVLAEEGLRRLNILLLFTRDIFKFFNPGRQLNYPYLYAIIRQVVFNEELIREIERVIDEEGNIKPDASPELARIRRHIQNKQRDLDRQFRLLIDEYRRKGWLTDNVESFRNGRRVLSVPAEHKRKIRGIIHDESATGRTAFIEPEPVIDINNDIFDLEQEERREIYRILRTLSAVLRPYVPLMQTYREVIIRYDVIQAKGRLASKMKADIPRLTDKPFFGIVQGRHPLLFLKNKYIGKKTIPFDLRLLGANRILVLSGPNAGGKSITMKSVGLLQLMLQSGLLVSVDPMSEMGIFHRLFADIGDQQSLEDDLSTYSSRLSNARLFIEQADARSLVLIDEFGSGTDPLIGGAIAEAVLDELNEKEIFGVITTHYSNLKVYAFKTKGLVNGSMHFDKDKLSPTYELKIGRPGSSYAFEIAVKSGLPETVLKYARKRVGKNEKAVDELLVDLQREKKEVEDHLISLKKREQEIDKLIKSYDQAFKELEYRRKKMKLDAKELALQQSAQSSREMERVIREIKEQQNIERAREMAIKAKEERQQLSQEVTTLRESIYSTAEEGVQKDTPIAVGDFVRMRTGGATGKVETVDKKNAVVMMGDLRMTIKLRDLQHANIPLQVQNTQSIQSDIDRSVNLPLKLDIRGMRYEEALKVVEEYVDQAILASANSLRIVHGKGNGSLRKAVRSKLREYNVGMKLSHPAPEQGGDGVTVVELV